MDILESSLKYYNETEFSTILNKNSLYTHTKSIRFIWTCEKACKNPINLWKYQKIYKMTFAICLK